MPFAPFTGVHHHEQSVVFGGALLADATESTFTWLFTSWLEAMSGWQPGFIITDYDSAITTAVQIANCSCKMFEFEGILCRHHYILKQWSTDAKDEADMDTMISVELQGSLPKGKNSYFDVLYQEAVKCAEKGMASDHSFKVVLAV
ncbi:hypothetical protein KPL70_019226 [Citrus sinensis]|nr:hypothetical protein KPL70_019226 [Citrus sinensis]